MLDLLQTTKKSRKNPSHSAIWMQNKKATPWFSQFFSVMTWNFRSKFCPIIPCFCLHLCAKWNWEWQKLNKSCWKTITSNSLLGHIVQQCHSVIIVVKYYDIWNQIPQWLKCGCRSAREAPALTYDQDDQSL